MIPPPPRAAVVVGTRGSALARAQTQHVVEILGAAWPGLACEVRTIVTRGDRTQATGEPLPEIGGKGLFTAELEQALRAGEIDLAVHSLKDLPTEDPAGIVIGAVGRRENVRDCLVSRDGFTLQALPPGAVVGTSSLRRAAQLRALRPELEVRSIRGNVDTRIRKVQEGEFDAVVLAAAGIRRLGLEDAVTEYLSEVLPAPGQGALAVQCRAADGRVLELLAAIDDPDTRAATTAEREFLRALGAGCTAPVAAYARTTGTDYVELEGLVLSRNGLRTIRQRSRGEPVEVGARLARQALERGADRIIAAEHGDRPLGGRKIVLTRPRADAAPGAGELERLGAWVSIVPLVAIEPVEDTHALDVALESIADNDWVVFTSANSVAAVRERAGEPPIPAGVRVAAVGPATADAATRLLGIEPAFVPERFAADAIVDGLGPLEGAHVLLPQSEIAEPRLAADLRARGASVDAVTAYRTVEVEPTSSGVREIARADAVLLASGSAARSYASLAGRCGELELRALLVCIGPKTADVAREAGLRVGLVAEEATAQGMIQALVKHFSNLGESE